MLKKQKKQRYHSGMLKKEKRLAISQCNAEEAGKTLAISQWDAEEAGKTVSDITVGC